MGIVAKLGSILGGNIGDAVAKVAGVFKIPPEQVEAHAFELEKIKQELASKALDAATAEIQAAGEIIKAEAQSQSWLPRNVRPLLLLFWGLMIVAVAANNMIARYYMPELAPMQLDPWVYKLTAIGYTGYVGFRTWEKLNDKDN